MNLQFSNQRNRAMTLTELVVIVAMVFLVMSIAISQTVSPGANERVMRINCVNNLKQMALSFRIWEGDHNNQYPMTIPVVIGGAMEQIAAGNVAACFQVMSNELSTPKILICPADQQHFRAANFTTDFNNSHLSYFLNLDAREVYPQELLSGDDNFAITDVPLGSGLQLLPASAAVSWTAERHVHAGNLSFADGSVQEESTLGLQNALVLSTNGTPVTTVRIVIP